MPAQPLQTHSRCPAAARAYIALGSNLGDSPGALRAAVQALHPFSAEPLQVSSFWDTTPVDCPPSSPRFLNAVVALVPREGETPESLLAALQGIERQLGRTPKRIPNEARLIDLDLLAFGAEVRTSADLTLPHPRAHQRKFVLAPLADIAPGLILPGQSATVRELLGQLESDEIVLRRDGERP